MDGDFITANETVAVRIYQCLSNYNDILKLKGGVNAA